MAPSITRRSMLGSLVTAGALAAIPESIAHADQGAGEIGSLADLATVSVQATPAQPGLQYERYQGDSFVPDHNIDYSLGVGGWMRGTGIFFCPLRLRQGEVLREIELYLANLSQGATAMISLFGWGGQGLAVGRQVEYSFALQTVTIPLNHVVNIVNDGYGLLVQFPGDGAIAGVRIGFIAPTGGLITVPQVRKLDTRTLGKVPVGAATRVDLAPEVPAGARAALVNVTATNTDNGGFVTAFPGTLTDRPDTSTLNWTTSNTDIANNAIVELGGGTSIMLFVGGSPGTATHLLCDLIGYFI